MNIFPNYIPNKIITVDKKDVQWMNESIKKKIMDKKYFNAINKNYDAFVKLQVILTELSKMILKRNKDYRMLLDKLNDPHTSAKSY